MIRGVKFLFDERGEKLWLCRDLRQARGLWEDILDVATANACGLPAGSVVMDDARLVIPGLSP